MNKEYTTEECLQAYYDSLEEQLAEKDAMIDWLADNLAILISSGPDTPMACPLWPEGERLIKCREWKLSCADCWKEAAQEAIKKND